MELNERFEVISCKNLWLRQLIAAWKMEVIANGQVRFIFEMTVSTERWEAFAMFYYKVNHCYADVIIDEMFVTTKTLSKVRAR